MSNDKLSDRLKRRVQAKLVEEANLKRQKILETRMTIAKAGIQYYQSGKFAEAVLHWEQYIRIVEDWKEVPAGTLGPQHFELRKEAAEMLLIAGIFWDLARMYDRTTSDGKVAKMRSYLTRYIQFSKGTPYEPICAETLRKYIRDNKCNHPDDFREVYKMINKTRCFVATELADHLEDQTMPTLWRFRDQKLRLSPSGRIFIRFYYAVSPGMIQVLRRSPNFVRKFLARTLDIFSKIL